MYFRIQMFTWLYAFNDGPTIRSPVISFSSHWLFSVRDLLFIFLQQICACISQCSPSKWPTLLSYFPWCEVTEMRHCISQCHAFLIERTARDSCECCSPAPWDGSMTKSLTERHKTVFYRREILTHPLSSKSIFQYHYVCAVSCCYWKIRR